MLLRGDIDAITGFTFTSLLNLEARGVKADDIVILPYPDYGVKLYGNAIIASPKLLKENPAAVKAFLRGLHQGRQGRDRQPGGGDRVRQGARRHHQQRARDAPPQAGDRHRRSTRPTPGPKASASVQRRPRLSLMASQVSDAFATKTRVNPDAVWNGALLPTAAELNILPSAQVMRGTAHRAAMRPSSTSRTSGSPTTRSCCAADHFAVEDIDLKVGRGRVHRHRRALRAAASRPS